MLLSSTKYCDYDVSTLKHNVVITTLELVLFYKPWLSELPMSIAKSDGSRHMNMNAYGYI